MIGRDPVKLLAYEAKRRPLVKEMWERRVALTDEEIDSAKLPLPWYRAAFKQARDQALAQERRDAIMRAARGAPVRDDECDAGANAISGVTVEYLGEQGWFKTGGENGFEVEIKTGAWLFFPETGGCWDYQAFFHVIPEAFLQNRKVASHTRQQYVDAWAVELCQRF